MPSSHHRPPPPDALDILFEVEDPLPGCYRGLLPPTPIERVAYVGPSEVTAKRPSRGRPRQHKQRQAHQP